MDLLSNPYIPWIILTPVVRYASRWLPFSIKTMRRCIGCLAIVSIGIWAFLTCRFGLTPAIGLSNFAIILGGWVGIPLACVLFSRLEKSPDTVRGILLYSIVVQVIFGRYAFRAKEADLGLALIPVYLVCAAGVTFLTVLLCRAVEAVAARIRRPADKAEIVRRG